MSIQTDDEEILRPFAAENSRIVYLQRSAVQAANNEGITLAMRQLVFIKHQALDIVSESDNIAIAILTQGPIGSTNEGWQHGAVDATIRIKVGFRPNLIGLVGTLPAVVDANLTRLRVTQLDE